MSCLNSSELLDFPDHLGALLVLHDEALLVLLLIVVLRQTHHRIFFEQGALIPSRLELSQTCEVLDALFERLGDCVEEHNVAKAADHVIKVGKATHDHDFLLIENADTRIDPGNQHRLSYVNQAPRWHLVSASRRVAQLLNRVENGIGILPTEHVDIAVDRGGTRLLASDVHLGQLFPLLRLQIEPINTAEYARIILAANHKCELFHRHPTQGKSAPLRLHRILLGRPETLAVDPSASLDVTLTHLEKLLTNLCRDPPLVHCGTLDPGYLFLSRSAGSVALDVDHVAIGRIVHTEEKRLPGGRDLISTGVC